MTKSSSNSFIAYKNKYSLNGGHQSSNIGERGGDVLLCRATVWVDVL